MFSIDTHGVYLTWTPLNESVYGPTAYTMVFTRPVGGQSTRICAFEGSMWQCPLRYPPQPFEVAVVMCTHRKAPENMELTCADHEYTFVDYNATGTFEFFSITFSAVTC